MARCGTPCTRPSSATGLDWIGTGQPLDAGGAARQARPARLLDVRLNQLHARAPACRGAGGAVRRRPRRHRRARRQVRRERTHREHPARVRAPRRRAPGRQRPALPHLADVRRRGVADRRRSSTPDGRLVGHAAGEFRRRATWPTSSPARRREYEARRDCLSRGPLATSATDPDMPSPSPSGALRFPTRVALAARRHALRVRHRAPPRARAAARRGRRGAESCGRSGAARRASPTAPRTTRASCEPQGLALRSTASLYVADRRNHAVRAVDLATGTSRPRRHRRARARPDPRGPGEALETALRSPWGGCVDAGDAPRSRWPARTSCGRSTSRAGTIRRALLAGTGAEAIGDGPRERATLAQPIGARAARRRRSYFADASPRRSGGRPDARRARCGRSSGTGLFDFGDRDGAGDEVRLQHDRTSRCVTARCSSPTPTTASSSASTPRRALQALPGEAGSGEALYEPAGISAAGRGCSSPTRTTTASVAGGARRRAATARNRLTRQTLRRTR